METIILLTVAVYFIAILASVVYARYQHTGRIVAGAEEFFLARRNLPTWVLMLTYLGTFNSTFLMMAFPSIAYGKGLTGVLEIYLGIALILIVGWSFGAKFWRYAKERNLVSPISILSVAYTSDLLGRLTALVFVLCMIGYLAMQLASLGIFITSLSGGAINYLWGVGGAVVILGCYAMLGGMRAVAWTDVVQVGAIYLGIGLVLYSLLNLVWPAAGISLPQLQADFTGHFSLSGATGTFGLMHYLAGAVAIVPIIFQPQLFTRWMMARNAKQPKYMNVTVLGGLSFAVPVMALLGLTALIVLPDLSSPNAVAGSMMQLFQDYGPVAKIAALIFSIGLLGAAMSTADSLMLAIGQLMARNVIQQRLNTPAEVGIARVCMAVALAIAFIVGMNPPALVGDLLLYSIKATGTLIPAYLGIFWLRRRTVAAVVSIGAGLAALTIMIILGDTPFGLNDGFWTLVVSATVYGAMCWLPTRPVRESSSKLALQ